MMKLLLTSLVVLATATPASAAIQTTDGSNSASYEAALARHMPVPPSITVHPSPGGCPYGPMPRPAACTESVNGSIVLYIDPDHINVIAVTHEVGHAVDFALGSPAIPGYDREKVADTWARCAIDGPNTLDDVVYTPSYTFQLTADEYRADCATLAQRELALGWDPGVASGEWRRQPQAGLCAAGEYYVECPKPATQRKTRWPRWLGRWRWGHRVVPSGHIWPR